MPINKESTPPPPKIGKIGPYTVFVTPPATPKPAEPSTNSPQKAASPPTFKSAFELNPPPVQAPPILHSNKVASTPSDGSVFGFFWNAVAKVQNAHSSLDEYVAHWFGLNQSKYQWALDDYYESKGVDQADAKATDKSSKMQNV